MRDNNAYRILVVEDEVSNIDTLYRILISKYDIIVAKNGKAAIRKAEKHNPNLILLDIILPDMTGFDVIVKLKNSNITRRIPVIFITSLNGVENEERGLTLGAVDYITKPLNNSIVRARVNTHLQIVEYINTIERLCKVDALTNIANRRYLDSHLIIEWERAMREEKPLGFLMIDIDLFKNYNDKYGHPQGDALLKAISREFIKSLLRPADFIARWGGEEFVVLLPNTNLLGSIDVAERIRENIMTMEVPYADGTITKVTVSIGVNSEVPIHTRDINDFVSLADKALYLAKSSGRNRVYSATDLENNIMH